MNPKKVRTEVIVYPRVTGHLAEVRIIDFNFPVGIIFCEVDYIPKIIKALRTVQEMANADPFDADCPSTSKKGGRRG
jgi:hypothetical protein